MPDRAQAMGDDNGRLRCRGIRCRAAGAPDVLQDRPFRLGVHRAQAVIKNPERRILVDHPRYRDALLLATGQPDAPFADLRIETLGESADVVMDDGNFCASPRQLPVKPVIGEGDIFRQRSGKKETVLRHIGDALSEPSQRVTEYIHAVDENRPLRRVVKTQQQVGEGTLTAPHGADDPQGFSRPDNERDVSQDLPFRFRVTKSQPCHPQLPLDLAVQQHPFPIADRGDDLQELG